MSPTEFTHSPVIPIAAPFDLTDYPELSGINSITGTGLVARISTGVYATRTLTGTTNQVTVTDGNGVAGNPTISLPQNIHTAATPTFGGLTLSGMTAGSVLFAGTSGVVSQDNSNLFWNDTNNRLGVRTTSPSTLLHLNIGNTSGSPDEGLRLEVTGNAGSARGPKIVFYGPAGAGTSSNNGELHSTNGYMNLVNGSGVSLLYINKITAYAAQVGGGTALDWLGNTRVLQVKSSTALVDYNDGLTNMQSGLYSNWYRNNAATNNIIANGYYGHLTFNYYNGVWGLFNSATSGVAGGGATPVERLRVTAAGNLLIGTTTETASSGLIQLATGTTAASGILWGTDTNLYRSAANTLKTDDTFRVATDVEIIPAASANRYITLTGSNGGNPTISVSAGSLAITPATVFASTISAGVATLDGVIIRGTSLALTNSFTIGPSASVNGINSLAIGSNCSAVGDSSTAIGRNANTTAGGGTSLGVGASAGSEAVAIGVDTVAGSLCTSIGRGANTTYSNSIAIGKGATTGVTASIAIGINATTQSTKSIVIGSPSAGLEILDSYFGTGEFTAVPYSHTIHASGGLGTDIAGANLGLAGGRPTGAGAGGYIFFSTAVAGLSGSTIRNLVERMRITSPGNVLINTTTDDTVNKLQVAGTISVIGGATLITTSTALTDGAGAGAGTLTNAPAAGDPTKWIGINDNGTTRYIPAW